VLKYVYILIIGAGLLACSSVRDIYVEPESVPVTAEYEKPNAIDSMIQPYRTELDAEMSEVIAKAEQDFERGRPNGVLNNWSTDALLMLYRSRFYRDEPVMSMLNVGGLRNPISKGDVLLSDMYKLMPFDNEVVFVKLPISVKKEMEDYLLMKNGEPIGGAVLKDGELTIDELDDEDYFWVITSDYLLGGGDKMYFFKKNIEVKYANQLLRDAFIEAAKAQGTLIYNDDIRIWIDE
jgi:2',3'-cyclic-nucleotide 2'-phosphodiesterase (5'-nucleotidase family)